MRPPVGCDTGSRQHWYREGREDGRREMLWLMAIGAIVQLDQDMESDLRLCRLGASTNYNYRPSTELAKVALRALGRDPEVDLFDTLRGYGGTKWATWMLR